MNSAKDIAAHYMRLGKQKSGIPWYRLMVSGIMAGAFIALAGVAANTAACMITNTSVSKLVSALIFPAGLVMIVMSGAELFTGNCLMVLPAMTRQMKVRDLLRCWLCVYAGNFIGAALVAWMVTEGNQLSLFGGELAISTIKTGLAKTSLTSESAVIYGILCNFLVCVAVWIGCAGKTVTEKIAGMYLPVVLFVVSGFEHSIANMYYIPAGLFAKMNPAYQALLTERGIDVSGLNMKNFLLGNLVPVTLGNIIGGAVFVLFMYVILNLKNDRILVD